MRTRATFNSPSENESKKSDTRPSTAPMDWLGRARVAFTHHGTPLALETHDGQSTDLLKVVEASTPPCQLNPLLFNGHLHTMYTVAVSDGPPICYRRRIFDADHNTYKGTFAVDFAVSAHDDTDEGLPPRTAFMSDEEFVGLGSDDRRPMLIVLHGLSGGSYEVYLRQAIAPLLRSLGGGGVEGEKGDWAVCVVNSRGCAKSKITSGVLFNARATWDVRQVVAWARKTFPNRPLFGLGFSLGANILTNYVGEEGNDCQLSAAVVVGNPFDLGVSNKMLQRTLMGKHVYERAMGSNLKRLISLHKSEILKHTQLDWDRIMGITFLHEFDREVQCPTWGYPTEEAYYRDASSVDSLLAVRIPFLAVQAEDDPIACKEAIPYEEFKQNPYTVLCSTSLGGHLGFFEIDGTRWHARPVCNFLKKMAEEIKLDAIEPADVSHLYEEHPTSSFQPMRRKLEIRKT